MAMSQRGAILEVLGGADAPLHYSETSEQILSRGYYKTDGATPAATVTAQISPAIKHEGESSLFMRVGKGIFSLRPGTLAVAVKAPAPLATAAKAEKIPSKPEIDATDSIIRSFGMYWQRDLVVWKSDPKMYGQHQA